jgi:cyclopropane-fatty-acyl-phospholipid synthase
MWDFDLTCMEVAFRRQHLCVYQIQLAKRVEALPVIRDYMVDEERAMAAQEAGEMRQAAE